MATTLSEINNTLLSIKRDTATTARRLSGKGSSAEEAREGLKQRAVKRDAIAKPTAPKAPAQGKGGGGGGIGSLLQNVFAKGIDWMKWFAIIGLGAYFRKQILAFIKAAFKPFGDALTTWWDGKKADIGNAWEGVLDATGFNAAMKFTTGLWTKHVDPFINWFDGALTRMDQWLTDSFLGDAWGGVKDFFMGEMVGDETGSAGRKGGLFSGVKTYVENIKKSIGQFGEALGLIDADGNITGVGILAGAGGLATLFTFLGPAKLLKAVGELGFWGVKSLGGLFIKLVGGLGKLVLWTGPKMLGTAALWIGKAGLKGGLSLLTTGFTALSNLVGVKGAFGTALNAAAVKLTDWKDGFGKGGMKKGLKAAFTKGSPLMTGLVGMLPALVGALAVAGLVSLVVVGLKKWGDKMRGKAAAEDTAAGDTDAGLALGAAAAKTQGVGKNTADKLEAQGVTIEKGETIADVGARIDASEDMTNLQKVEAKELLVEEQKRMGGAGLRIFYNMQQEAIKHLGKMVRQGMLVHKDGPRAANAELKHVREWMLANREDPKPITKSVLAGFGLTFADPKDYRPGGIYSLVNSTGLDRDAMKKFMKETGADTYDIGAKMEEFGGLTGLMQSSQGLGHGRKMLARVQDSLTQDRVSGKIESGGGRHGINQEGLTAVIKELAAQTAKANLIAQQAIDAQGSKNAGTMNQGPPGTQVSVVDRSSKTSAPFVSAPGTSRGAVAAAIMGGYGGPF